MSVRRFRCTECGSNYYVNLADYDPETHTGICQNCAGKGKKPETAAEAVKKEAEEKAKKPAPQKQSYDPRGPGQTTPVPGTRATANKPSTKKKEAKDESVAQ